MTRAPERRDQGETIKVNQPAPTDMRVLIAADDPVSRGVLETLCRSWGYDVTAVSDGRAASTILESDQAPLLAILDWTMPHWDGPQALKQLRQFPQPQSGKADRLVYVILLTAGEKKGALTESFQAEADDYVIKPFDQRELRARVQVGFRVVRLQIALTERVLELEKALGRVKNLQGLLPMCSYCKRIRNDRNYWQQVESYIVEHSDAEFTHGVCPHCYETIVKRELEQLRTQ
ncbi:MAG: response regulator [Terriglobia bacterium]